MAVPRMTTGRAVLGRWWVWPVIVGLWGVGMLCAVPPFAGPDEGPHVIRSVSLTRGNLVGRDVVQPSFMGNLNLTEFPVPATYREMSSSDCYLGDPRETPDCMSSLGRVGGTATLTTYMGHNPPLYYAVTGVIERVAVGERGVMGMHLVGLLVLVGCVALGAWVLADLQRRTGGSARALDAGLMLAITPTSLYLNAVANPNGGEIALALVAWCAALAVVATPHGEGSRRAVWVLAAAGALLMNTRALSPLWVAMILVVCLAVGEGRAPVRARIARLGRERGPMFVLLGGLCVAGAWTVWRAPLTPLNDFWRDRSTAEILRLSTRRVPGVARSLVSDLFIGDGGRGAVPALLWVVALGLAAWAMGRGWRTNPKAVFGVLFLSVWAIAFPVIVDVAGARRAGYFWDGRYSIPVASGIPLLLGWAGRTRPVREGLVAISAVLVGVAQILAHVWVARRYAVGVGGTWWYAVHPTWGAPIRWWTGLACALGGSVLLWARVGARVGAQVGAQSPHGDGPTPSGPSRNASRSGR